VFKSTVRLFIEANDNFDEQAVNVAKYYKEADLFFKEKRHFVIFDDNEWFGQTCNQI
jgi:hypothetical protein